MRNNTIYFSFNVVILIIFFAFQACQQMMQKHKGIKISKLALGFGLASSTLGNGLNNTMNGTNNSPILGGGDLNNTMNGTFPDYLNGTMNGTNSTNTMTINQIHYNILNYISSIFQNTIDWMKNNKKFFWDIPKSTNDTLDDKKNDTEQIKNVSHPINETIIQTSTVVSIDASTLLENSTSANISTTTTDASKNDTTNGVPSTDSKSITAASKTGITTNTK